jgi:hypothetical protein
VLAGMFIGENPVMRIVETAMDEVEVVANADALTDAPVVVLMSDQTRGTAEAIVSAFYENKRGVLVGTPTAGSARIATVIDLNNGGALELLNKSVKSGQGQVIDGRGVFPIVCLSNIRSNQQQNAFFLNVINGDFNARDFNKEKNVSPTEIRQGCPTIASGTDEDALSTAVSVKILTDKKISFLLPLISAPKIHSLESGLSVFISSFEEITLPSTLERVIVIFTFFSSLKSLIAKIL